MKMYDLGEKMKMPEVSSPAEAKTYYPEVYIHDKELPDFPKGDFEVTVVMSKKSETYNDEGEVTGCSLCIKSIGEPKKAKEGKYLTLDEAKEMMERGELS